MLCQALVHSRLSNNLCTLAILHFFFLLPLAILNHLRLSSVRKPKVMEVISMAEIIFKGSLLFLGKFRNKVADILSKGDAVDRDLHKLIVDDTKDIKSKIDLIARKDLVTCINIFAVEFENVLHLLHRTSKEDENYSAQRALSKSIKSLETANEKATEAFSNEALDISDRILATKYRIRATLLATLDKPANAFTSCIKILEQLNDDPTIQRTFGVQLSGGPRAFAGRSRREEIISSVCEVNRLVYDIMQIAVCDEDSQFYRLPRVHIGKEVRIDPLRDLKVADVLRKRGKEDVSVLWSFGQGDEKLKFPQSIATNTLGNFIIADSGDRKIKVFDRRGNFLYSFRCVPTDDAEHETLDLDTDGAGNMYLLVIENGMYKVYAFDKHGNWQWNFPMKETSKGRALAVDSKSGNVLVLEGEVGAKCNAVVEVYKNDGRFVRSFGERYLNDAKDIAAARDGCIFVLDSSFNGDAK